jgi:hypothetical protein
MTFHRNEKKDGCMRPRYVAYALLGFFFVTEPLLRQGKAASSRQEGPADRGSTRMIGASVGLALLALLVAPLLIRLKIGRLRSERLAWSGIVAMIVGLVLRIWESRVLLHPNIANECATTSYHEGTLRADSPSWLSC